MSAEFLLFIVDGITLVGVVAFVLAQWRLGRSSLSSQTIQAYKEQLEITEKRYTSLQDTVNLQAGRIGELKGALDTRDAQIKDYKQILENRNPNLEDTLKEILLFMKGVDGRLTEIAAHQKKPFIAETNTVITK